jgi:tetratricopeptide (TPR) repeat protein
MAVDVFRETGDRFGLGVALGRLAYSYLRLRKLPDAADYLHQALANARDIDDQPGEAWALEVLGAVASEAGQKNAAGEAWQNALTIYEGLLDNQGIARMQTQLANPGTPAVTPRPRP